jgi:predicted nucleic acid-binding protein
MASLPRRSTTLSSNARLPFPISSKVWEHAIRLADRGRSSGVTVPLADLLVFACAKVHGLDLAHDDRHFDALAALDA